MRKAVIDMGTNSTRLAVAEWSDRGLQMVETKVAETRLGEGLGSECRIKPIPLARNVEAVQQFVKRAGELGVEDIRITATSAVRDAVNKEEVKQAIGQAAGVPLEILPGEMEARLSYLGASGDFLHWNRPLAVLDIGGGSTELVYPLKDEIHSASVNMGAVRLLEHDELRGQVDIVLRGLLAQPLPPQCALIAVGGTNTCLMAMELGLTRYDGSKIHGQCLSKARVDAWCQRLLSMTQEERIQIPGMKEKRADIMPYGVLILQQAMELLDMQEVCISDKGLVYGLLLEAFGSVG